MFSCFSRLCHRQFTFSALKNPHFPTIENLPFPVMVTRVFQSTVSSVILKSPLLISQAEFVLGLSTHLCFPTMPCHAMSCHAMSRVVSEIPYFTVSCESVFHVTHVSHWLCYLIIVVLCRMHSVVARSYLVHIRYIGNAPSLWYRTACKYT